MSSPFPGMDPYLEGQEWEDFHSRFISVIAEQLSEPLYPQYIARIEARIYVEQESDDGRRFPIQADVAVLKEPMASHHGEAGNVAVVDVPVLVPITMLETIRETYLQIRTSRTHQVVAVIEMLSPANKKMGSAGRQKYLTKRIAVLESSAHLIELDLLRGGARLPMAQALPGADYYVILSRAPRRPLAEVWPIGLRKSLPSIPVPLSGSDADVQMDLQSVFESCYERARYDDSLDYSRPPDPALGEEDAVWAENLIQQMG